MPCVVLPVESTGAAGAFVDLVTGGRRVGDEPARRTPTPRRHPAPAAPPAGA
ncbi:predicted protein [Streptomyces pristinaespiralis ATCC 25486]|uniref:Predicted protein n=1 Tax=Streptomyces pristinaespiralis (strain ATCC 25486 / DSM 40338 / CBS 914.69 / JCM 4507 / KCC S-0507 / NBRC 13074 / NRRL 2958 / 5647) TaxID=457429 RepID=D6X9G7_STRE2|nr:predicted protein [Streptomyces pristinaespiralis ATCC 25486]